MSRGAAFRFAGGIGLLLLSSGLAPRDERPEFWQVIERAVDAGGARAEFDAVLDHMAGVDAARAKVAGRLSRVRRGLSEPWTPPATAEELRGLLARGLEARRGPRFEGLAAGIADWLDVEDFADPGPDVAHEGLAELDGLWSEVADPERRGIDLLTSLSTFMELANALVDESLGDLDDASREALFEGFDGFHEAWHRDHFPGGELTAEQAAAIASYRVLLARTPSGKGLLLGVSSALLRFAEPAFLDSLARRLARTEGERSQADRKADLLATVGDEGPGRVVLFGRKGGLHIGSAALTIDLGGNDAYVGAAVVDSQDVLVRVVLDLAGDDHYQGAPDGPGPVFAAGGAVLLVDRRGDDHYGAKRLGNAASVLGFAALVDLTGDDAYESEDFAEGQSTGGIALLFDFEGDDSYAAWAYAQGADLGRGFAALVDGDGNDSYLADLHWPDVYGNSGPDVFHGASQGYGTGIRPNVSGGIAALVDLGAGEDRYQAGSFSQGGGYYFSFGLKYDGGGDDESFGSRYGGGFGVHQAVGVCWDAEGNDQYTYRSVAHAGMAWDEGVGYLIEDGGDDTYHTGDLSCGGAAQTAIAITIDRGGKDTYTTGRESQGGTGSHEYHDKPALGVLLDLGGKQDSYSAEGRLDGTLRVTPGVEVFFDTRAKDMHRALASKELR